MRVGRSCSASRPSERIDQLYASLRSSVYSLRSAPGRRRNRRPERRDRAFTTSGPGARATWSRCSGRRRSTCPASVSASLPSIRICTRWIGGQVGRHGVDDRVDREQLGERSAGMIGRDLAAQIDEGIAALGHVERAQRGARRNHRDVRRGRRLRAAPPGSRRPAATVPSASGTSRWTGTSVWPSASA